MLLVIFLFDNCFESTDFKEWIDAKFLVPFFSGHRSQSDVVFNIFSNILKKHYLIVLWVLHRICVSHIVILSVFIQNKIP